MVWFLEGACFLPTFLIIWSSCTFVVNYIIAVFRRDVDVVFPYISDTGATPPESCIFSMMASISAFAGLATMFARYLFVQSLIEKTGGVPHPLNTAGLIIAFLSCCGMLLVATFQETTVRIVHDIGAFVFFVFGVIYIILQTVISYKSSPHGTSKPVCAVRAFFAFLAFITIFPTIICGFLVKKTNLHWDTENKDYGLHLASSVCEWITAFSFIFYFFTFIQEFQKFTLRVNVQLLEFI